MSERQDYASQDLRRRPFRTAVIVISMTTSVASTVFLFLFADSLLDITLLYTSGNLMQSLRVFFEAFIWATLLLVLLMGGVVVSSTVSMEMVSRRKDIGLMKSIGSLMDTIFDHFMAQAMILLLVSVVLGVSLGTLFYLIGMGWLASVVTGVQFTLNFPFLQIGLLVGIYLFLGYFASQKPIYDAVHESPISAMNPDIGDRVRRIGLFDSFGLPFKIATRRTGRRVKGMRRTLLSLFLGVTIASVIWIGGGVVETTTDAYITRSMGTNVIAVGNPELLDQYYGAYHLTGSELNSNFSFIGEGSLLPSSLIQSLEENGHVTSLETRLLHYTGIRELPGIIRNPTTEEYEWVGQNRTASSLIMGIDWESTQSSWYYEGYQPNATNQVWIGGKMANAVYEDPLVQSLEFGGFAFDVQGIAFELANGGMVAMVDLSALQTVLDLDRPNLLLLHVDSYSQEVISEIDSLVESHGFDVYLQDEVLDANLEVVHDIWVLLQPLSVMALLGAFLNLMNYLLVSVFGRFRDYKIMRSIGATPDFIVKTMIAEGLDMGLKSGIPAIFAATLFSVYFLVPEAAVPSVLYLPAAMTIMAMLLVLVTLLAAVPVYFIFSRKSELRVSEFSV
ncbi:ABC transporter permease [Candidatus Thorarchaeota archaeon]|nr:MAG: ABC transporter permease [Candidatus Thorarchaeota archaeon]